MTRARYPSDITDREWAVLEPLLPHPKQGGRPQEQPYREIMNAIFYIDRSGCAWRMLPHHLPNWRTVQHYFRSWRLDGTWERVQDALREKARVKAGRNAQPSAAILDSQSVKTSEKGG